MSDTIELKIGGLERLEVPAEDVAADGPAGQDLDLSTVIRSSIRRADQFEPVGIDPALAYTTRLMVLKTGPGGLESKFYWVSPELRNGVYEHIKDVLVLPMWSFRDKQWIIWIIGVNDMGWFKSIEALRLLPPETFKGAAFTISANKVKGEYLIRRYYPAPGPFPGAPSRPVSELLGQALGAQGFIRSPDHPEYARIIAGEVI